MNDTPYEKKSVLAIGRSLGRLCRYAGNAPNFYSVLQHSMVVALLLAPQLRLFGLMHDASESFTNDQVSLYKREGFRMQEQELSENIFRDHDIPPMTAEIHSEVKAADRRALIGEVWVGAGVESLKAEYGERDFEAEALTLRAIQEWPPIVLVTSDAGGREFDRLFHHYKKFL